MNSSHPNSNSSSTKARKTIHRSRARTWAWHPFCHGNQIDVYQSGSELYPRMLEAISEATDEVNFEVYIFRDDETGQKFIRALANAARRGVTVRFIHDAWGSFSLADRFLRVLTRAGVETVRYRPISLFTGRWGWRRRNHRKLLSVDEEVGFIGGINVGQEYLRTEDGGLGIRDVHFEVHGPVVQQMNDIFSFNWQNHQHGKDDLSSHQKTATASLEACHCASNEACARIVGGRWKNKNLILEEYVEKIQDARKSIRIIQAYFLPNQQVLKALYRAEQRGCKVQLLVPGSSDVPPVQYGTRYLYDELLEKGIEVYEFMPSFLHAKAAVIDREWVLAGTFNFDYQSIFHNLEVNISVQSRDVADRMTELFERNLEESRKITSDQLRSWSWYERFLASFWYNVRWLL